METRNTRFTTIGEAVPVSRSDSMLKFGAVALSLVTFVAMLHPSPLVLPFLSAILVTASIGIASAIAWRHRAEPQTFPDRMALPGLLVFFGFAAAIICDPDQVVQALGWVR